MKNKKWTSLLIVLLSVISIALVILMINMLNGNFKLNNFRFSHQVSNELLLDKIYDADFNKISINANASNIYVKVSTDDNVRVIIYGGKDNTTVETNNNRLSIILKEEPCIGFCFNNTISKIEVYLPENYEHIINIVNNYGDIKVEEFLKADIDIEEDCGDVTVFGGNSVKIDNNYGDITLHKANVANIKEAAGNVEVGTAYDATIESAYGDIKITSINNYLDLKSDCGDIKIDNVILNKNSIIKSNLGNVKIGSINDIYIDATTDLGNVKINNNYRKSDIILKIENDCGDITVNN